MIDALLESLITVCVSTYMILVKQYHAFIYTFITRPTEGQQEYNAFFSLEKIIVSDVLRASRAITKGDADKEVRIKRALHAQSVVTEAEEKLTAIYFKTPEELKTANALLLNFLRFTKDYCQLIIKALSTESLEYWEATKVTYTQSMDTLSTLADELDNFAQVMDKKADRMIAESNDTEELAKKHLKRKLEEKFGKHDSNS